MKLDKFVLYMTGIAMIGIIVVGLIVLYIQEKDSAKRASEVRPTPTSAPTPNPALSHIANPASENCVKVGGSLKIEKNRQGQEYGVCVFPPKDGVEGKCEEWALMNGKCPVGGYRIKSKASDVVTYCVITGGEFHDGGIDDQGNEKGKCYFPNKIECDMYEYFSGTCRPTDQQ